MAGAYYCRFVLALDFSEQSFAHLGPMAFGIRLKRTTTHPRLEANGLFECVDSVVKPLAFDSGYPAFVAKCLQCRNGGTEERDQLWRELSGDAPSHYR